MMKKTLVLGLGNDLLGDDGVGLWAARRLGAELRGAPDVEVRESAAAGLALLEELAGYDCAILLDAIQTGKAPPGTVHEFALEGLGPAVAPSGHYAGLPEVAALARALGLPFPKQIVVLAVEAGGLATVGAGLSGPVRAAVPELVARARRWVGLRPESVYPKGEGREGLQQASRSARSSERTGE